jgi:predicted transcriptional regulator
MKKTTLYLPDEMKRRIERLALEEGRSEAQIIRQAIEAAETRTRAKPRIPIVGHGLGDPSIARHIDRAR